MATSAPFAASDNFLLLTRVAAAWHCRPSELLGLAHETKHLTTALQVDIAAAVRLWSLRAAERGANEEWW